jgi:hypothetical protein
VAELAYVTRLEASVHDPDTVYAAFTNFKQGDFRPYAFVSRDRGRTWSSIAGDLPEREIVWALKQDHVKPELLFAGTEFGVYFTVDEGAHWVRLEGGLPTIQVRDIDIHRGETDLVLGTFGRGFFILDDYSPLRQVSEEALEQDAILFPTGDALRFVEKSSRVVDRGATFFTAPNPPFGAVFTYYLEEPLETRAKRRIEAEKKAIEAGEAPRIPTFEELRAEEEEIEPKIVLTVRTADGEVVRRIDGTTAKGLHRVNWDLRWPSARPVSLEKVERNPWDRKPTGPLAAPGTYSVTLSKVVDGVVTDLAGPQSFEVVALELNTFAADDPSAALLFELKTARLERAVRGALKWAGEAGERLTYTRSALYDTPGADTALLAESQRLQTELADILVQLRGDETKEKRNVFLPPSISERVNRIVGSQWDSTAEPTATSVQDYEWAAEAFTVELDRLKALASSFDRFEQQLESAGAPWTPGRLPEWKAE